MNENAQTSQKNGKHSLTSKAVVYFKNLHLKMHHKPWWRIEVALVAAALFFGLISGLFSHLHELSAQAERDAIYQTKQVIVAAEDLKVGETLSKAKVKTSTVLAKSVTANYLTPKTLELALGRPVGIELKMNDPLLLSSILGATELSGISSQIPTGKRLFTLTIADSAANNGFVKPNDHVDVITHLDLPHRGTTTFILLQDVTLISVGRTTVLGKSGSEPASNVSFFIDAKDAEMLSFAQNRGTFSLSLRNPSDIEVSTSTRGIDLEDFLDNERIHSVSGGGKLKVTERGASINAPKSH